MKNGCEGVPSFNPTNLTQQHFIGPGSPNPDEMLFNKDLNNFGPAVGFAWQLPWFGKGKTTLRGGYQVSYSQISRLDPNGGMMNVAGSQPGLVYPHTYGGDSIDIHILILPICRIISLLPSSGTDRFNLWRQGPLRTAPKLQLCMIRT